MKKNIFQLCSPQLKEIAIALQNRIVEGLEHDGKEISCIPTYVIPKSTDVNGQAVVLDLGGTNYRVATVTLKNGKATIHPENG